MKQTLRNRLVASIFMLAVLTPLMVQASHALDRHEHIVCTAENEKHFHADELDCLLCCTPVEHNSFIGFHSFTILDRQELSSEITALVDLISLKVHNLKSSRAPPPLLA